MVHGGMSIIKYLLFVFNFIFVVSGIALISVGAVVQSSGLGVTAFLDSKFFTVPILLIALGVIIFLVAFLGCCGAVKENYCMVMSFGVLLFIIFVIELGGGIAAYVHKGEVKDLLKKGMHNSLEQNKDTKVWDDMQHSLDCCGVDGPSDYLVANETIPVSCCSGNVEVCTLTEKGKIHEQGCYEGVKNMFTKKIAMVGGAAIGVGVVELLGIIFAFCLGSAIKKEYEGV